MPDKGAVKGNNYKKPLLYFTACRLKMGDCHHLNPYQSFTPQGVGLFIC